MLNIKEFLGLNYYTSDLDQFLNEYDKAHPKLSPSQRQEEAKYAQIFALRDTQNQHPLSSQPLWDKF